MLVLNPLKAPPHVEQNAQQAFGLRQYTGSKILSTEFKEYRPITIVFSQLFQAQNVLFCGVLSASIAKQISIQNQNKNFKNWFNKFCAFLHRDSKRQMS